METKKSYLERVNKKDCFVIAEAGVNHNGSLRIAKQLVDSAVECGVDAIKFQTYNTDRLVHNSDKAQYYMLRDLELQHNEFRQLKKYCDDKNILFLSTPHTDASVDFLNKIVPIFKIGSGDLNNFPMLEQIAKKEKPIILSTGMATMNEIEEAVDTIRRYNNDLVLLHCVTMYPCPRQYTNLRMMKVLHDKFDCPVGFSSHSTNIDIPLTAVLLGASVIEVHFTLNKKMKGPDHKASLNPKELKELVTRIKIEDFPLLDYAIMGSNIKRLTEEEERLSKIVRKSIYSFVNIPENTKITNKMLIIKRPGIGIPPKGIYTIIGKTTKHFIRKNTLIKMSDVK